MTTVQLHKSVSGPSRSARFRACQLVAIKIGACRPPFRHLLFAFLDVLPLCRGPRERAFSQNEPPADRKVRLPEDLRFPTVALAVEFQFTGPGEVILPDFPDQFTRPPLACGRLVPGVHRIVVVAHALPFRGRAYY